MATAVAIDPRELRAGSTQPAISVRDLTKVYTMGDVEVRALRGVSLDIAAGDFVAVT